MMLTKTIDIHDAKEQLLELLSVVDTGTEVILTEADMPRARLVSIVETVGTTVRKAGLHPGSMEIDDDFDEPLPDEFWFGSA